MEEFVNKLGEALKGNFDKKQDLPNQYVVGYYRTSDNELIGYHLSTFCQFSKDILAAKRYNGENPYPQLEIISKNLKFTIDTDHKEGEMFSIAFKANQTKFNDLGITKSSDLYIDAVYLAEGTPKQSFKLNIVQ